MCNNNIRLQNSSHIKRVYWEMGDDLLSKVMEEAARKINVLY